MRRHAYKWIMAGMLMLASLAGCGGGGGGSASQPSTASTAIKGTASAGILYPGTVNIYAVDTSGTKGALLATAATAINGTYNASLGSYKGALLVEASGTYTDEATGRSVTISATKPLHAMVDAVDQTTNNNRVVAVTPLTELAWRKASANGANPTVVAAMAGANALVDDLFKISDILGIEPVRPDNASMAAASQESQAYTLVLASLSSLASTSSGATDSDKLDSCLASLETEIEAAEIDGSMSATTMSNLSGALANLSLSNDFPFARDQLSAMGKKSQMLTVATSGNLPTGTRIYSIQGTIALPVNKSTNQLLISLRADSNGKTLSDVFFLSGIALGMGGLDPVANYSAPQQQVSFSVVFSPTGPGVGIGDLATLAYEVATGATVTTAEFSLVSGTVSVKDINGADIPGVTLVLK